MLIDVHIHISLSNLFTKQSWAASDIKTRKAWVREIFKLYKERGIYGLRDGGDNFFASKLAREVAKEEGMIYKTPIYALFKRGHYGAFLGKPIAGLDDFKDEFAALLNHNLDHLKIILTGIVSFKNYGNVGETTFILKDLKYMVEMAKSHGLPVMVHANGRQGVERAIKAGVSTIEHGYLITEAELYGMAEKDIIWVPTLAPLGNIVASKDPEFKTDMEVITKVYEGQAENVQSAIKMGLKVALGSDAGAYSVGHGSGLIDEIGHFERIGLARKEVEKMCIENGSKALQVNPVKICSMTSTSNALVDRR